MNKMVVSVLGPDRPGIIAAVANCLLEVDGNIENVAQTILQSEFSGTFIVLVPENVTLSVLGQKLNQVMDDLSMRGFVNGNNHFVTGWWRATRRNCPKY